MFILLHWLSRLCTSHSRKSFTCSVITHQHCSSRSKLFNTQWYFDNHPGVFDKYSILLWQPLILPNSHFLILILLLFAFVKSWCWPSQLRNEDWWRCHGAWHASLEHCQLRRQHILWLNPKIQLDLWPKYSWLNSENTIWKIWLYILLFDKRYTSQSQDKELLLAPECQKIFERPKYSQQVCRAQNRYVLNNDVRWTRDRSQEPTPPSAHSPPKTPSPLFSPILPHNETHLRFKSQGRVVRGATSCCISPPLPS